MVNHRTGTIADIIAIILHTPAEINLFHVGKEIAIKTSKLVKHLGSDKHGGTRSPEDVALVIVLPVVFLKCRENASTAERISILVDETTSATSILESILLIVHQ